MKNIFITGATGFLGGALLVSLLENADNPKLLCLVKAPSPEIGLERIKDNLIKQGLSTPLLDKLTENNILTGDLGDPDSFLADSRLNTITHVVNCAAIASFGKNPNIWNVNVKGTFKLARRMSHMTSLKCFIQVGTAMSCLPEPNTVVNESKIFSTQEKYIVDYTWSKAAVERRMQEHLPNLPLIIVRPSIIVGHTRLGCTPSPSIFWVFKMVLKMGKFVCDLNDRIDIIPVDYCAEAIRHLLYAEKLDYDIYHISAGTQRCVTFSEIDLAMSAASETPPVKPFYQKVSLSTLNKESKNFPALFGPCNERILLRAMKLYGYFSCMNVVFDNIRIIDSGLPLPPKFTQYLHLCHHSTKNKTIAELMAVDFK